MKVSIAQINPRLGDFNYNKEKVRTAIHKALEENANILIIPFGAISGFPQGNLMASDDFRKGMRETINSLAKETVDNDLSVFIEGQEVLANGLVNTEPTAGEFLTQSNPLPSIFNKKNYDIYVNLGPKIFEKNRAEAHELELKLLAKEKTSWVFDVNLAGATDEILYTGLSAIVSPQGEFLTRLKYIEEDFITVDLENPHENYPISEIPAGEEIIKVSIVKGIKDYFEKNHFKKILVSVSGGIDSALVLALASEAVGSENISAVYLPSRFSSEISREEAQLLCSNLNVPLKEIPIDSFHQQYLDQLNFLEDGNPIWKENIQARIRGSIVMSIANAEGSLVLATGNKTEIAVGYCTLYGDTCGGLAPIADLLKTEVRALCRYLNYQYKKEIIPERTITRPPSAELRENQIDEDSLPNYEFLDQVLFLHCEEGLDCHQIIDQLGRQEEVLRIFTLLYQSSYKRKQLAMGIKISKRFFGLDWHIPSTVAPWFKI